MITPETKLARDIRPGDRICFRSGDLINWQDSYHNKFIPLSSSVLSIVELLDDELQFSTVSGRLKVIPGDVRITLAADSDYDMAVQSQYVVDKAEVFSGVSIE